MFRSALFWVYLGGISALPVLSPTASNPEQHSVTAHNDISSTPGLFRRQSTSTDTPDPSLWYTLSTVEAGSSNCLFSVVGVDGSAPYPVRFEPCNPLKDDALWRFEADGTGLYFVYNKAWPGTSKRLDIHCPEPSLCIMWMGPSGDIYNNQRWALSRSGESVKISSLGLPNFVMSSKELDGGFVAFMTNESSAQGSAWNIVNENAVSPVPTTTAPATITTSRIETFTPGPTTSPPFADDITTSAQASTPSTDRPPTSSATISPPALDNANENATEIPRGNGSGNETETRSSLNNGEIAAIVIGSIAGFATVIGVFFAPATVLKFVTCGRRPRTQGNHDIRMQIPRAIRASIHLRARPAAGVPIGP